MASALVARLPIVLAIYLSLWLVSANEGSVPVWTWLDGSRLVNQPSTLTAGNQYPGCRAHSGIWTHPTAGLFWMFGGQEGSGTPLNDLWLYDMPSQEWTNVRRGKEQAWPGPRYGAAVCGVAGSSVVVYGGARSAENLLSDTWLYHLHNESWVLLTESLQPDVRTNMAHWCTHDSLWIYRGVTSDLATPPTMWKFTFESYEWTEVGAPIARGKNQEEMIDFGHWKTATWVLNDTQLYFLGGKPSGPDKACRGKSSTVKNKCDLWRYSTITNEWEHVNMDAAVSKGRTDNGVAGVSQQPSCPVQPAFWSDADSNLWLLDSDDGSIGTCGKTSPTHSNLWMLDLRLMRWMNFQESASPPGRDFQEWTAEPQGQPPPRAYCASWAWNSTYYLFGGLTRNGSVGALNDLWDFRLLEAESLRSAPTTSLAVPPVAVFFLSLGALGILSLFVFGVIFFTKCSSGPRLKPPNHFGDKIRYSPVEMDEVFIT
ncbi:uncharacterized protein LOC110982139 [Acanthaster planci]|uniref:Uncharacterized protein LOC110982139 n=1 Tax=Acanthaster planci TaxID=133434 RepID=A0A8B7YUD6_ACAPL|nr:uncharacterized protein LOC110982139 [Acanthaster planci]XP_022096053.1 uncharacterized protein LOC110982139 [Acanthaster planci]XP_022096063.1 uncharacterized protein LOC110982139 [Acanthaster planci]XP_022096073.1 uncharacterized protein LOC110982139 [Acanthaster planci]XP_022096082.1 uncharacterized protein LOC110982139 [Acanthaster planci]XP_022096090.1 uncharacterized protein LOC110982139 [Acanthaster planci]